MPYAITFKDGNPDSKLEVTHFEGWTKEEIHYGYEKVMPFFTKLIESETLQYGYVEGGFKTLISLTEHIEGGMDDFATYGTKLKEIIGTELSDATLLTPYEDPERVKELSYAYMYASTFINA